MKTLHRTQQAQGHPTPAAPQTQGGFPGADPAPPPSLPRGSCQPCPLPQQEQLHSPLKEPFQQRNPQFLCKQVHPNQGCNKKELSCLGQAVKTSGLCRKINFLLHAVVDFEINPSQGLSTVPSTGSCCTALLHHECTATLTPLEVRLP